MWSTSDSIDETKQAKEIEGDIGFIRIALLNKVADLKIAFLLSWSRPYRYTQVRERPTRRPEIL